jgi:hypothetical protein
MRHGLYEDPITHKFAVIRLPSMFRDGDAVTKPPTPRWFETREEAVAALFDQDDDSPVDDRVQ